MVAKKANKLKKSEEATQPELEDRPRAAAVPTSWEDELTPEQREIEEKKKKDRQKKADESAVAQKKENERRQFQEAQRQKEDRATERENKRWEQAIGAAKARALKEGVVEAEDWGDAWWAQLPDGTWKETTGRFYCVHCSKHLDEGTLEAHLKSEGHQKKLLWLGVAPGPGPQSLQPSPQALRCPPCSPTAQPGAPLEDWQERTQEGYIRCVPCGKMIDENHLAKEDHFNRLERWRDAQRVQRSGYPEPELPYVAYVPCDETIPNSERWMKCLLCMKWINDNVSHSGTSEAPNGSKEHQKNLRNYGPGDPWYEERVTQERLRWHPPAGGAAPQRWQPQASPAAQPAPAAQGGLPAGWEAARDAAGKLYYFHRGLGQTQWEHPSPAEAPAPPPLQLAIASPLPAGWTMHRDERGNTYYHNAERGESCWQPPPGPCEESVEV